VATTDHPAFHQPDNAEAHVWRYMDLPKLLSFLQTKSLYFCQQSRLSDPFEGSATKQHLALASRSVNELRANGESIVLTESDCRLGRYSTYINCWCMPRCESHALWRIYGGDYGLAIRTTYSRLVRSVPDDQVFVGMVKYIDYSSDTFSIGNAFEYAMHKRNEFEYECEVRLAKCHIETSANPVVIDGIEVGRSQSLVPYDQFPPGLNVPVCLDTLEPTIIVAPGAPRWFHDVVCSVASQYQAGCEVELSSMHREPFHPPNVRSRAEWQAVNDVITRVGRSSSQSK